ncbi:MAG: 1-deoxy-D-xylulose-5-phosphate reductoisomerase, partial [Coriobacteriaceae bacterium]|nr:1-deoxy-D-xylulose-5-phosphate reductoisomerase [Coriobacteriaceae bacterium]
MQHIALLGASGSIGRQTLDVCRRHADKVKPVAIAVNSSLDFAISCAREFDLSYVVNSDTSLASRVPSDSFPAGTEVIFGSEHLAELCELPEVDCVVNALVGAEGISAGYTALRC